MNIIRRLLAVMLCLCWMGVIFYMSHTSGEKSNKKSIAIVSIISGEQTAAGANAEDVKLESIGAKELELNLFLRKNAHGLEFLILALLVSNVLFSFGVKGKDVLIYILFTCLLYAVLDEFHQVFVGGRSSNVGDVLIDFLGSCLGAGLFYGGYYAVKRRFSRRFRRRAFR